MREVALQFSGGCRVEPVQVASSLISKALGLMFRKDLPASGLLLVDVQQVHTYFMRFPLDLIYLDKDFQVIAKDRLATWQKGGYHGHCRYVLELKAGSADGIALGDRAQVLPVGR